MNNIDELRREFDEFLEQHESDMTNIEVIKKAAEIEEKLFDR